MAFPAPTLHPAGPASYTAPAADGLPTFSGSATGTAKVGVYNDQAKTGERIVITGTGLDGLVAIETWRGTTTESLTIVDKDDENGNWAVCQMPTYYDWNGVVWCWAKDGSGNYAEPYRLNGPENLACDTYELFAGVTGRQIRIRGKNLTTAGYTGVVVIEPNGGGTDTELSFTATGDYELVCDIPDSLAADTYDLWVHNGTGGAYGWGKAMTLVVSAAPSALGSDIDISGSAATEANLRGALTTMASQSGGGRVLLAAGTYELTDVLNVPADRPVQLVGQGEEAWSGTAFGSTGGTVLNFDMTSAAGVACIPLAGDRSGLSDLSARIEGNDNSVATYLVAVSGKHVEIDSCTLVSTYTAAASACLYLGGQSGILGSATHKDYDCDITNCDVYGNYWCVNHALWARYWRVNNNTFYMGYAGGGTAGNTIDDYGSRYSYYRDNTMRAQDRAAGKVMNRGIMWHSNRCHHNTSLRDSVTGGGWDDSCPGAIDTNQWEQIICHIGVSEPESMTVDTGSSSSTVVLTDTPTYATGSSENIQDFVVYVTNGEAAGQWRTVTNQTTVTLTVTPDWRITPVAGDKVVVHRAFRNMMVGYPTIDPTSGGTLTNNAGYQLVGVLIYQGCHDNYVVGCDITGVSRGVGVWTTDPDSVSGGAPSSWNEFRSNAMSGLYNWTGSSGGEPSPAVFVQTHSNSQTQMDNMTHWIGVGNVFRDTTVDTIGGEYVIQLGWQRKDNPATNGWTYTASETKGFVGTIIEDMDLTNCGGSALITISPPLIAPLVYEVISDEALSSNEELDGTDILYDNISAVLVAPTSSATNIWGTYGDDSGGAGTGGPTPSAPDPAGTYAQCNDVVPDAPADDTRTLWAPVKSCGGTTPSVEWLPIDDATYPVGTVFRITDLTGGDLSGEQCAFVSDDYSLSELVPDTNFPSTGSVICSGYPDCDECNATCYKITDCLTAAITYSNSVALAGVTGFQSVINGRCYTVAVESDKSNCCPDTDTDVSPAGSYASCEQCEDAINPQAAPCECPYGSGDDGPSSITVDVELIISECTGGSWGNPCSLSASFTMAQSSAGSCSWGPAVPTSQSGCSTSVSVSSMTLNTSLCRWQILVSSTGDGETFVKGIGQTPMGEYQLRDDAEPGIFTPSVGECVPPGSLRAEVVSVTIS